MEEERIVQYDEKLEIEENSLSRLHYTDSDLSSRQHSSTVGQAKSQPATKRRRGRTAEDANKNKIT